MRRLSIRSYASFQLLMLLVLFGPLMVSLLWVAVRFPIYYPDYVGTTWHEVELEKLFVIFELPSELAGIEIEIVVKACERVLIIALASMLIALPIGILRTKKYSPRV